ncbi:MAG TPA: sterol desaturase family protein [Polyangiaceae bacterium]
MNHALAWLLYSPLGPLAVLFAVRLVVWSVVERRWPAYTVNHRAVFFTDLGTSLFLFLVTIPIADYLIARVATPPELPSAWTEAPLLLRVGLYLILADFGHYWVHRLMHTRPLWRVHKWHHAPSHMSWLAGNRETLWDRILVSLPYIFLWPVLAGGPWWLGTALLMFAGLKNDWMHLNVRWNLPWLEWAIVTPRYHHVHHSTDPAHYDRNLGALFSVWDRLFGTYARPDAKQNALSFGLDEKVPITRLIAGL